MYTVVCVVCAHTWMRAVQRHASRFTATHTYIPRCARCAYLNALSQRAHASARARAPPPPPPGSGQRGLYVACMGWIARTTNQVGKQASATSQVIKSTWPASYQTSQCCVFGLAWRVYYRQQLGMPSCISLVVAGVWLARPFLVQYTLNLPELWRF